MRVFRDGLRLGPGTDVRDGVLDDLATYFELDPDECVTRCRHWEQASVAEWQAADRGSPEGLRDFYQSVTSWSFDLLWYAYLQAEGYRLPVGVMAARYLAARNARGGRHLDFGSGVGTNAQLFSRLGFTSCLADVSTPLLDFARFRLDRRGDRASFLDLNDTAIRAGSYEVITAIDTLTHVPDVRATLATLHDALVEGGWLIANFDVRQRADESAWHLYDDDVPLRLDALHAGFRRRATLPGGFHCYQKTTRSKLHRDTVVATNRLVTSNPLYRYSRRIRWPGARRIIAWYQRRKP